MSWEPFNRETFPGYWERVASISEDARPRWGRLPPVQLMRHLCFTFELSLGERTEPDISNALTRTLGKWLFFHVFTRWPGGVVKAPASFTPAAEGSFAEERAALEAAMRRFLDALDEDPDRNAPSPLLGPLPLAYWQRIHGIHCSHHLRQYGR